MPSPSSTRILQARTHSSGFLSPTTENFVPDTRFDEVKNSPNGSAHSKTSSKRQAYHDALLATDFSNAAYDREKLCGYCKALQTLGRDLRAENARLRNDTTVPLFRRSTPSIRRETDDSDFSLQKKYDPIPPNQVIIAWDRSIERLRVVKGRAITSPYVQLNLPSFWRHWWRDSVHLYHSRPRDRKPAPGDPSSFKLYRKFHSAHQDETHIREINLGELPLGTKIRRYTGRLKTLYILPPETSTHQPEMAMSRGAR